MRILLIGECSNLHWNLAEGLRILGHEVCVSSSTTPVMFSILLLCCCTLTSFKDFSVFVKTI